MRYIHKYCTIPAAVHTHTYNTQKHHTNTHTLQAFICVYYVAERSYSMSISVSHPMMILSVVHAL